MSVCTEGAEFPIVRDGTAEHYRPTTVPSAYRLAPLLRGCSELLLLGRARHCQRRRRAAGDDGGDIVEIAGADLALVLGGRVPARLERELALL